MNHKAAIPALAAFLTFIVMLNSILTIENKLTELYNNGKERCLEVNSTIDYCFYNGELDNGCFCENGIWFGSELPPNKLSGFLLHR